MEPSQGIPSEDLKLSTPFRWFCVGPSGVGKTAFLKQLLCELDAVLKEPTNNIIYCYATYQPLYDEIKKNCPEVMFVEGFPSYVEDQYLKNLISMIS